MGSSDAVIAGWCCIVLIDAKACLDTQATCPGSRPGLAFFDHASHLVAIMADGKLLLTKKK
jgi:hypothetical protein